MLTPDAERARRWTWVKATLQGRNRKILGYVVVRTVSVVRWLKSIDQEQRLPVTLTDRAFSLPFRPRTLREPK